MTKSGKHCGKRRNCTFRAISSFVTMFSKSRLLQRRQKASTLGKGLNMSNLPTWNVFALTTSNQLYCMIFYNNMCNCLYFHQDLPDQLPILGLKTYTNLTVYFSLHVMFYPVRPVRGVNLGSNHHSLILTQNYHSLT